jgi:hypothetical protein
MADSCATMALGNLTAVRSADALRVECSEHVRGTSGSASGSAGASQRIPINRTAHTERVCQNTLISVEISF